MSEAEQIDPETGEANASSVREMAEAESTTESAAGAAPVEAQASGEEEIAETSGQEGSAETPGDEDTPETSGDEEASEAVDETAVALAEAEKDAADWRNRAMRAAADLENARRRFQKDRDELRKYGADGLLKALLPVVDNLERALAHADSSDGLAEGVQMILRQFAQVLENNGAVAFEAEGQPFDPQIHEAMTQVVSDEVEPGHVVSVFQRGWKLHGRLIRPAMVIVAAAPEPEQSED